MYISFIYAEKLPGAEKLYGTRDIRTTLFQIVKKVLTSGILLASLPLS